MYHGAEHKCINCIENGMDLTVENARKSSTAHKRCGTSFLLIRYVCQHFAVYVYCSRQCMASDAFAYPVDPGDRRIVL